MTHTFDPAESRRLEAVYLTPDVVAQRAATLAALSPAPGERVVDVGCGPGLLAAEIAHAVGSTGHVTGLDISEAMLTVARQRCAPVADRVTLVHGDATALPLPTASFDAAVTTQVLEYVPDIQTALAELYRVVRPGGRVVILDTDWDSIVWHATNPDRMRTILAAWTRRFADPYLPRTLAPRLKAAGFEVTGPDVLVIVNPDYDPNTYSLANAKIMATFAKSHGVPAELVEAWTADLEALGQRGEYFFSLNRYLFTARRL
jgi:arsenite methyltransferase